MTEASVTAVEMPADFGMTVLTRSLEGWPDAWLVELDEPIRPVLKTYEELPNGAFHIDRLAMPATRHVVVNHTEVHENYEETLVYPAFASGEPRYIGEEPQPIAGGDSCTHVDALEDLSAGYDALECTVEGERCPHAMGMNQVLVYE